MNVIILAAGEGNRLKPLTNDTPKCLVKLFGKSLLDWQLDLFQNLHINDITIVKGYLQEKINFESEKYFLSAHSSSIHIKKSENFIH